MSTDPFPPYRSVADVPFLGARERGAKVALRWDGGALTYAELDERARRFAAFLAARGVGRGERVAILLPNLPEVALAYFGAIAAGAVAVPVNYRLSAPEVAYVLEDSGAAALVTTRSSWSGSRRCPRPARSGPGWRSAGRAKGRSPSPRRSRPRPGRRRSRPRPARSRRSSTPRAPPASPRGR